MSSVTLFARHHNRQIDCAVSSAFAGLAGDRASRERFAELLLAVRTRAPRLLEAPPGAGSHPGVDTLVNLARYGSEHVQTVASWAGSERSWRATVHSLAQHLVGRYRVPAFLAAAWYSTDELAEPKRRWFVAHSQGAAFRSLDLPLRMTRAMEHLFLASGDHFGIDYALRRAELSGIGADATLVDTVLAARSALDLRHGEFWRTVWHFLVVNRHELEMDQVAPLIDFLHSVRHESVAVETPGGVAMRPPPLPAFSLKGRTVRSVMRLMEQWHRGLATGEGGYAWEASGIRPFAVETPGVAPTEPPIIWELTELTSSAQLRAEGSALRHCVASYGYDCWKGRSRIWSLRRRRGLTCRPIVTVEVNPLSHTLVQARGFRNRRASGRQLGILQMWAAREGLRVVAI